MTKRLAATLGTVSLIALSGWLMLRPQPAVAAEPDWLTDLAQAQKIAAKENKDLLINFTGSDWCGWCIRLREEVFTKPGFEKANDSFVMVEMDFPQDESLVPPKTREQNEIWSNRFGIEGFPTIVLTDAKARPYGTLGYTPGGPKAFLAELGEAQKVRQARDEILAKAEKAQGVAKAKLLDEALEKVPAKYRLPMYKSQVKDIIALDDRNQAGLKSRYTKVLQEAEAEEYLKKLQQDVQVAYEKDGPDAALKLVADALKSQDAKSNPVLRSHLAQAEVNLLVTFEKTKQALAKLGELAQDKSFSKAEQKTFRQTQAQLLKDSGQTEQALNAYDALLADADAAPGEILKYLTDKAEVLAGADRPKDALDVYNTALKKTKKGTNEWLIVQVSRGDLLTKSKQPKQAAVVYDEMLTLETLQPIQQAMLLVRSAEAHHAAGQAKETETQSQKADKILKDLSKAEQYPPQLLEELQGRVDALGKNEVQSKKDQPKESKEK